MVALTRIRPNLFLESHHFVGKFFPEFRGPSCPIQRFALYEQLSPGRISRNGSLGGYVRLNVDHVPIGTENYAEAV
jgi:hypothetical protein